MELKSYTYTSWARPDISSRDIQNILDSSQINNPLDGVTGVLVFNGTAFMQILEGSEQAIDDLVGRLENDSRHSNMSVREEKFIAARTFPNWTMAYLRLEDGRFEGTDAVARALQRDLSPKLRNVLLGLTRTVVGEGHPG